MSTAEHRLQAPPAKAGLPRQIPYIIGNEACERFSFYGMRNILTPFLVTSLLLYAPEAERAGIAKDVFHSFVIGVYFFPLLGGWIADRLLGKYRTILWLSLVYCVGHACLAAFDDNRTGFYTGSLPRSRSVPAASNRSSCRSSAISSIRPTNTSRRSCSMRSTGPSISGRSSPRCFMPIFLRNYGRRSHSASRES